MKKSKTFRDVMDTCTRIHDAKSHDYADADRYSNFKYAAQVAGITVDQVFAALIGVKLARLKVLLGSGKSPLNESVLDTHIDLVTYAGIWAAYRLDSSKPEDLVEERG